MRVDWQGVFPALMTEFTQDGALDLASTQRHAAPAWTRAAAA